ncbi:MAG: periplasmic heavy metal sensor [Candidatus Cloacimonetes bacterium]|nr:periplasmic heavy metal sensor [Candidatus Cloacimonadota bacterium]
MSRNGLKALVIVSLAFNIAFLSAFIYRGIQITRFQKQPFPHPFRKPPMHIRDEGGPIEKFPPAIKDKIMCSEVRDAMQAMGDLKRTFFDEMMKEKPDYDKLEKLKGEMSNQSQLMEQVFADRIIEVRKTIGQEEAQKYREMFEHHTNKFHDRNHKPRRIK